MTNNTSINGEYAKCWLCGCNDNAIILRVKEGTLAKCNHCNLIYAYVRPTKNSLLDISIDYLPSSTGSISAFDARMKEANEDFERIEKYSKKGKVFDVGASNGLFAKVGTERKWKIVGNEISIKAIEYAKKTFGITLHYGFLDDIKLEKNYYDVVTMIQVIEHLRHPIMELNITKEILKAGGLIYITTPIHAENEEFLIKNHMLPHHLTNFTEETLRKLFKICDLKIIFMERYEVNEFPYIRVLCKK